MKSYEWILFDADDTLWQNEHFYKLTEARFAALRTRGATVWMTGLSGSGKSTILALLAGLAEPDHGRIALGDTVWLDRATGIDRAQVRAGRRTRRGRLRVVMAAAEHRDNDREAPTSNSRQ